MGFKPNYKFVINIKINCIYDKNLTINSMKILNI